MTALGIDIAPGGRFAYAVVAGGQVVDRGTADARELLAVLRRFKPRLLAVDNVGELLEHGGLVVKALGRLPFSVEVVEVTRGEEGYASMEELVRRHLGISRGRLEPLETAVYLATLAEAGVGTPVKLFEEETVILIHRRMSTSPGGMSRNRYMRNVAHRIRELAGEVERRLKAAGLDYDVFMKASEDLTSARFVVYADREVVRRYVKPMRSMDVAISIYAVPARGRGAPADRYLIVGVDPGIVTGIAVMTLTGEVLDTVARRGLSRGEALRYIYQWGTPVVVATDVASPPEYVRRLAAMCGAVLYAPPRDLSTEEKSGAVERAGAAPSTSHERDALAAAYRAYLEYRPKFERLEREFGQVLSAGQLERAKALVVRGLSVAQAVSQALRGEGERAKVVYVTVERECAKGDEELRSRVRALEYDNRQLSEEVERLRAEVARLRGALEGEMWRDAKYREMEARISRLSEALRRKEEEVEAIKGLMLEALMDRDRFKLVHVSEVAECRGGEPVGTICGNCETVEEAVRRGTMGVPLKAVARIRLGDYYLVDLRAVGEAVERIKAALDRGAVDVRKILDEYRRGRLV